MFISILELFKVGIGPSSSHTMGPMVAAKEFIQIIKPYCSKQHLNHGIDQDLTIRCTLKGSLAATGKGHATDRAIALGFHGYLPKDAAKENLDTLVKGIWEKVSIAIDDTHHVMFTASRDIIFDTSKPLDCLLLFLPHQ